MAAQSVVGNTPEDWDRRAFLETTSWDRAMWSRHGQEARMSAVARSLDVRPEETVLDFGCGDGRFSDYLPESVAYIGYDTSKMMLRCAMSEHPQRRFVTELPGWRVDHVVCIGPFNLSDNWTKTQTFDTLTRLWVTVAKRSLIASLYRDQAPPPEMLAYDGSELALFADRCATIWGVRTTPGLDNDLLLCLWRDYA